MPDSSAKERLQKTSRVLKVSSIRFDPTPDASEGLGRVYKLLLQANKADSQEEASNAGS